MQTIQLSELNLCDGIVKVLGEALEIIWSNWWYSVFDLGGFPHDALHALSCALTKNYNLYSETSTKETKESFFKQVLGFCEL